MTMWKINNVILNAVTKIVVFIILTLSVYLFFSGHSSPGGGFIGGLVLASAFVLMFIVNDIATIKKEIPFDFKRVAALGAYIVVATGFGSIVMGDRFLSQTVGYHDLPILGATELTTVTIFEAGGALVVVEVVGTII